MGEVVAVGEIAKRGVRGDQITIGEMLQRGFGFEVQGAKRQTRFLEVLRVLGSVLLVDLGQGLRRVLHHLDGFHGVEPKMRVGDAIHFQRGDAIA